MSKMNPMKIQPELKMTDKELRELDAWIGEHVMGAEWVSKTLILNREIIFKRDGSDLIPIGYPMGYFLPTVKDSDAMVVLAKLLEKSPIDIWKRVDGSGFSLSKMDCLGETAQWDTTADTLTLAICLFVKKLYDRTSVGTESVRSE